MNEYNKLQQKCKMINTPTYKPLMIYPVRFGLGDIYYMCLSCLKKNLVNTPGMFARCPMPVAQRLAIIPLNQKAASSSPIPGN